MDSLLDMAATSSLTVEMARQLTYKANSPLRVTEDKLRCDCLRQVMLAARQGKTECRFEVPAYTFGLPLYSQQYMRDKVGYRLQKEGWGVKVRGKAQMLLTWGESRQAAAPKKIAARPKAKPGKKT